MKSVAVATLVLCAPLAAAQEPAASDMERRVATARAVVQLTGSAKSLSQVLDGIEATLKKVYPTVPEQFWTEFKQEVKFEELADRVAPIYAKHLTVDELEQLLAFYQSPIGRKLIEVQPAIAIDTVAAAREWGQEVTRRILERMKQKGYAGKANAD